MDKLDLAIADAHKELNTACFDDIFKDSGSAESRAAVLAAAKKLIVAYESRGLATNNDDND